MVQVREITKKLKHTLPAAEREDLLKKSRKEDDKMVSGKFEFVDAQGGWFEFAYRKYPGQPIMILKLVHDEICDLPMGIVKHLNNTVRKIRKYNMQLPDSSGRGVARPFTAISRVRFIPTSVLSEDAWKVA